MPAHVSYPAPFPSWQFLLWKKRYHMMKSGRCPLATETVTRLLHQYTSAPYLINMPRCVACMCVWLNLLVKLHARTHIHLHIHLSIMTSVRGDFSLQSEIWTCTHKLTHMLLTQMCIVHAYTRAQICWEGVWECGRWGGSDEGTWNSPSVPVCGEDCGAPSPSEGGKRGMSVYMVEAKLALTHSHPTVVVFTAVLWVQ